ncbi:MAG: peroxiredoxin [Cyanobacteria bacterium J06639_1]
MQSTTHRFRRAIAHLAIGLCVAIALLGMWTAQAIALEFRGGEQWGTTVLPLEDEPAPEFALADESGTIRHLSDWRGQWVVLYFYPKDFTSGCTIEARRFQQNLSQYEQINTQIVGISADSVDSHREFCDAEGLRFPLLSDITGEASASYGSWMGDIALRNTFLIDPDGVLRAIDPIVNPSLHHKEVFQQLQQLQRAA